MAQFLYWLDQGDFTALLQHAWLRAVVVGALANLAGVAAVLHHCDGARRHC